MKKAVPDTTGHARSPRSDGGQGERPHQPSNASIIVNNRVVFNIAGDKYRLIVAFAYCMQVAYIKFVGTHAEYDKINAATVDQS